ncbi:DUF3800 domain-containing protein [Polaromonas sp. YR568]|uniref:DUF3800 domain-containing protein n=1 Tax=Polaromonas sp. YR568 TaxID=1855301 RepID=UPI00398BEEC6
MSTPGTQYALFESAEPMPVEQQVVAPADRRFSDYVVYVDESGDHSLASIDPDYPVFVLALCIFHKRHYSEKIIPAVEKLKFNYFGHDSVVLHENEIRKQKGDFAFLSHLPTRKEFLGRLSSIMDASNFILIACVVDKVRLSRSAGVASNPYHVALGICLEALRNFLAEKKQDQLKTHVVVECRGKREDSELELEFRRICDGDNPGNKHLPFDIVFADKKTNLAGLQLADLVARPLGLNYIRPGQVNQAFDLLKRKFYCDGGRDHVGVSYDNVGLIIYPPQKAKSPDEPTEAVAPTGNPQST